jgi:uncharacterized integral membrane protein
MKLAKPSVLYDGAGNAKQRSASNETGESMASNGPNERQGEGRLGGGAFASLIGLGLLAIFMIQNTEDVRLDFLVWHFTWPLWLLTIASAALGALMWFGVGVIRRHRRRRDRRDDRRD